VHALRSLQAVPFALGEWKHAPAPSQASLVHAFPSSVHAVGVASGA
jgi:hypothetical protein